MSVRDGMVKGNECILNNGQPQFRWNIVFVAEGYQKDELPTFKTDVQSFVDYMFKQTPFDEFQTAFNVYRIDVASNESGADDPETCEDQSTGSGDAPATFFDAQFCGNGKVRRDIKVDQRLVLAVVKAEVPNWDTIMVLINSSVRGGTGGVVAKFSKSSDWKDVALHEMGHSAFGLGDEYEYYASCSQDKKYDRHNAVEPTYFNITTARRRALLKWRGFVDASTNVPTMENEDCSKCDPKTSPVPDGTIGIFEGARHYHCGAFRPAFNCRMRNSALPFCAVCQDRIRRTLRRHNTGWHM